MLDLLVLATQSIATLLSNPLLGGGGRINAKDGAELLGLVATLAEEGDEDGLTEVSEQVRIMASQNRGPTPAEWASLRSRESTVTEELTLEEDEEEDEEPADEDEPDMNPTVEATPATETLPDDTPVVDPNAQ